MAGVNKVILLGRVGQDPEMRYTENGTAIANFSVATSEQWKNKDGKKKEKTEWHKVVAWKRLGEICGEYLNKGSQVYIEGRIETRNWEGKDGKKRYTTEVIVKDMQMLGGKSSDNDKPEEGPAF